MSEVIVPIVVVPVIFFTIAYIIKTVSDNGVRSKLVEKGILDENVKHLFYQQKIDFVPNSLKWGIVLIAFGLAVLIGQFVPDTIQDEVTISSMFILGGIALISYYFIATRMFKNDASE